MLVELSLHWLLFAGEKYFLGPFQSRSNLVATFALPLMYLPFKGRRVFGIGAGIVVRVMGALSLFLGSYLVAWRGLIQAEAIQDIFYPVVAFMYKTLANPIVKLTWQHRRVKLVVAVILTLMVRVLVKGRAIDVGMAIVINNSGKSNFHSNCTAKIAIIHIVEWQA